jgi:hypothetical protein
VSVGTQEEVDGDRFFVVADGDGCQEGSGRWFDGIGISGDAFRC